MRQHLHAMNSLFQHEAANTINQAATLINMVVGQANDGQTGYWILSAKCWLVSKPDKEEWTTFHDSP